MFVVANTKPEPGELVRRGHSESESFGCQGSFRVMHERLFSSRALWKLAKLWPVGACYGIGDLLQAFACNSASAPVVLVIGQCKLLVTALLSVVIIRGDACFQWGQLFIITFAAIAAASNGASNAATQVAKAGEVWGAMLAGAKALLSSSGAVLSEGFYKEDKDGFWVMSFRVQFMMLTTSLFMLLLPWNEGETPSLGTFFSGGRYPLCAADGFPACSPLEGGECKCVDRLGWDSRTVLSMCLIAVNGMVTGLTLKYLSALSKAICNVVGLAVFYPMYVVLGFKAFDLTQAAILVVIVVSTGMYTQENARKKANKKAEADKCADRVLHIGDPRSAKEGSIATQRAQDLAA
uniref:EamA domain-containing protein n=1 Tax=Zooxanthella nutricula TaxID=1333877 RepID=A0A7S2HMB7_9DINO